MVPSATAAMKTLRAAEVVEMSEAVFGGEGGKGGVVAFQ